MARIPWFMSVRPSAARLRLKAPRMGAVAITAALVGVALSAPSARLSMAQSLDPPTTQAPSSASGLSPEEGLVRILPLELSDQDQIPGYRVAGLAGPDVNTNAFAAETPATLALNGASPADSFKAQQDAGLVVGVAQRLVATADPAATGTFDVRLFASASSAAAYTIGQSLPPVSSATTTYTPVTPGRTLGDSSAVWHAIYTPFGTQMTEHYTIRWQHGPVVFRLDTPAQPIGRHQQADAEELAAQLDAVEAARPAVGLGPATVSPPATEAQRFQAGLQLEDFFTPACATPSGFGEANAGPDIYHPATWIQDDPDPAAALQRVDLQWKELIEAQQLFRSHSTTRLTMACQLVVSADAGGARADLEGFVPPSGWSFVPVDAPVTFGDRTLAFRATGQRGDGDAGEQLAISWTHGPVFLAVYMAGPSGTTSIDALAAFAQQIEAHFQANPILAAGAGSLP